MIVSHPRLLALGCALLTLPFAASAATQENPAASPTPANGDTAEAPADSAAEENKRICRYVKLDTASRRKTKVCRTTEEWRELNNPR